MDHFVCVCLYVSVYVSVLFFCSCPSLTRYIQHIIECVIQTLVCSVVFFSRPQCEGWPQHGCTLSMSSVNVISCIHNLSLTHYFEIGVYWLKLHCKSDHEHYMSNGNCCIASPVGWYRPAMDRVERLCVCIVWNCIWNHITFQACPSLHLLLPLFRAVLSTKVLSCWIVFTLYHFFLHKTIQFVCSSDRQLWNQLSCH